MTALADLLARLEKARDGNPELDQAIADWLYQTEGDGAWAVVKPQDEWVAWESRIVALTTSLDAALSLVPEGWSAVLYVHPKTREDQRPHHATLAKYGEAIPALLTRKLLAGPVDAECCATPALALCIAAMRARAAMGG